MARRILVLSKVTEAHGAGGMQRHLTWLLAWLAGAGAEITVVTTRGGALPAAAGVRTIEVPGTRPGRYNRAWWRGTRSLIRASGPDAWAAVVSEDGGAWGAIEALHRLPSRPPIVMFRHGTTLLNLRQALPPRRLRALGSVVLSLRDWLRHPRRLARHVDLMICISERIAASARVEGAGPDTDIRVIPLGVDLSQFRPGDPGAARRALALAPDVPVLLWAGRDVPGKRVERAIEVFDRLAPREPCCQLALAVAGPRPGTLARVEASRQRHGAGIRLFTDADIGTMRSLYQAAGVLLFPSVLAEGVPIVVMEALASGVPVLATPGPALAELAVFRARPDWLVRPDALDGWVQGTAALLCDPGAATLRGEARVIAERHYDLRLTARRTVDAVDQLIERWARREP